MRIRQLARQSDAQRRKGNMDCALIHEIQNAIWVQNDRFHGRIVRQHGDNYRHSANGVPRAIGDVRTGLSQGLSSSRSTVPYGQ